MHFTFNLDCYMVGSKTTLTYWMMVEGYPNFKEEDGGSIPGCEISSLLDIIVPCGQTLVLWCWHVSLQFEKQ